MSNIWCIVLYDCVCNYVTHNKIECWLRFKKKVCRSSLPILAYTLLHFCFSFLFLRISDLEKSRNVYQLMCFIEQGDYKMLRCFRKNCGIFVILFLASKNFVEDGWSSVCSEKICVFPFRFPLQLFL